MIQMDHETIRERVGVIRSELDEVTSYLNMLPEHGWDARTPCSKWNVGDVVAHLYWNAGLYIDRVSAGLRRDGAPAGWNTQPTADRPKKPLMEFVADKAISLRQEMGARLLTAFVDKHRELIELFSSVQPHQWSNLCYLIPPDPLPISQFVIMRISELSLHSWDIRAAANESAGFNTTSLPFILEAAQAQVKRWQPGMARNSRYRFELSGSAAETFDVTIRPGKTSIDAMAEPIDGTIQCDGETFILLGYGRITLEKAIASRKVFAQGNASALKSLSRILRNVR